MATLPTRLSATTRILLDLDEQMNKVDLELYTAERANDTTTRITALLERSTLWYKVADAYAEAGQEVTGAKLSAQRDRTTALTLQAKVEGI